MGEERYPRRDSIPADWLVPERYQPQFTWTSDEKNRTLWNVGRDSVDAAVNAGLGEKAALVSLAEDRTWTYHQLKGESDRLAGALVELGLRIGDRVVIYYPTQGAATVAALGVWKAGGAITPVPQQARPDDLSFYLEDTAARFVIVSGESHFSSQLRTALSGGSTVEHVIVGGADASGAACLPGSVLLEKLIENGAGELAEGVRTEADDLACVWHTAGTTGRPKASYSTHRRWLAAGRRLQKSWGVGSDSVWIHGIPLGNVAGTLGRFVQCLQHGATLVEPKDLSPESVLEAIDQSGATHLLAVPVTLDGLALLLKRIGRGDLRPLRQIYAPFLGNSVRELYDDWARLGYPLANPLGSSLFAQWVLGPLVGEQMPAFALGRPVEDYACRVVDSDGTSTEELPDGETGRLAIRGPSGITYWRRPELQTQDVVNGWSVTDDLVTKDSGGLFWYMGRLASLITTSGYKVASGEVEEVLLRHPAVREVAVTGLPDRLRGSVVCAFVALRTDVEATDDLILELQEWCKRETAPYKYPRVVCFVETLPRDPVGKVQTRSLVEAYLAPAAG